MSTSEEKRKSAQRGKENQHSGEKKRLLTTLDVSEWLGVPRATLEVWRVRQQGPDYIKLGALVRYRASDIERFISDRLVTNLTDGKQKP